MSQWKSRTKSSHARDHSERLKSHSKNTMSKSFLSTMRRRDSLKLESEFGLPRRKRRPVSTVPKNTSIT